jgi:hypothetical protein
MGVGAAMIDWAGEQAVLGWNAQWLRIDVWTTNIALHNYYEKRGFRFCRISPLQQKKYPSAALFQKPTSEVDHTAAQRFQLGPPRRETWPQRPQSRA